jgi:hypothetical protein
MRCRDAVLMAAVVLVGSEVSAFDCRSGPPPSLSSTYWDYLETCGCAGASAPSSVSLDFDRWLEVCAPWMREAERERQKARIIEEEKAAARERERTTDEPVRESALRPKAPETAVAEEKSEDATDESVRARGAKAKRPAGDDSAPERVDE